MLNSPPYFYDYIFFDETYVKHFSISVQIWIPILGDVENFFFWFMSLIFDKLLPSPTKETFQTCF